MGAPITCACKRSKPKEQQDMQDAIELVTENSRSKRRGLNIYSSLRLLSLNYTIKSQRLVGKLIARHLGARQRALQSQTKTHKKTSLSILHLSCCAVLS